ncbi:MAG: hypothetical protein WCO56_19710 [Verrucomicrobiota bacterium]
MFKTILSVSLLFLLLCASAVLASEPQVPISRVEQIPNLPQPYQLRDWPKVTCDYLNLILDFERRGEHLPLPGWRNDRQTLITLPSYVGGTGGPEAINFMAAVVSGSLVGLDMQHYRGHDWVAMCTNWFSAEHGVCGNNPSGGSGASFWYDLFPNVLFYQVCDLYPNDPGRDQMLRRIAGQWYQGCIALGASTNGTRLPDFDHLSFNLKQMSPVDNGKWIEPEGAAGVAWCEYMAWQRFKDPRFLAAADWSLRALLARPAEKNPLYEVLLPYAALTAVRMNAEQGRDYDVPRLLNWCFEPMDKPAARPWWGVLAERFGDLDCHGLVGSSRDTGGYAFAMNTYQWAGALAPLARYDSRYARAMGKWMLNLANASRLFYANGLPAAQQDHRDWAEKYDPTYCLGYEGLRKEARKFSVATGDYKTIAGRVAEGSYRDTTNRDRKCQVLATATVNSWERLEHIWEVPIPAGTEQVLTLEARCTPGALGNGGVMIQYASRPEGPWALAFTVTATNEFRHHGKLMTNVHDRVLVKALLDQPAVHRMRPAQLQVDDLRIRTQAATLRPFATGDARGHRSDTLNFCLYGSSHVGYLGGLIAPTSDEKILQVDLLRTDFYHQNAYPTFLYYNPHPVAKAFTVDFGARPVDLYDTVTDEFVQRKALGKTTLTLPADTAAVIVVVPTGSVTRREGRQTTIQGIVIRWR